VGNEGWGGKGGAAKKKYASGNWKTRGGPRDYCWGKKEGCMVKKKVSVDSPDSQHGQR